MVAIQTGPRKSMLTLVNHQQGFCIYSVPGKPRRILNEDDEPLDLRNFAADIYRLGFA